MKQPYLLFEGLQYSMLPTSATQATPHLSCMAGHFWLLPIIADGAGLKGTAHGSGQNLALLPGLTVQLLHSAWQWPRRPLMHICSCLSSSESEPHEHVAQMSGLENQSKRGGERPLLKYATGKNRADHNEGQESPSW